MIANLTFSKFGTFSDGNLKKALKNIRKILLNFQDLRMKNGYIKYLEEEVSHDSQQIDKNRNKDRKCELNHQISVSWNMESM